jgi:hypothetical protein
MHNGPAVKIYYYLSFFFYLHRTEPRTTNCPSRDAFFPRRDLYGSRNDSFRRCQLAHLSGRDTPKARRRSDRRDTRLPATARPTGDARKSRPCLARRLQQQHFLASSPFCTLKTFRVAKQSHIFDWVFFSTKKIKMSFKYVLYSDKRYHNSVINVLW